MQALHSVLAAGLMDSLPTVVGAVCAAVLVIALIVGFVKGWRRVSWSGLVWLAAGAAFIFAEPQFTEAFSSLQAPYGTLLCAIACIVAALLLYGVCSLLFRPRYKWVKKNADRFTMDENGVDYDEEIADYDDYEDYEDRKLLVQKGGRTPSLLGRLFGGVFCVLNTAAVLAAVLSVALLVLGSTSLGATTLAPLFENEIVIKINEYVKAYALDLLVMGIIVVTACKGYRAGLFYSIRSVVLGVGMLAAVGVSFWLPFSKFVTADGGSFVYVTVTQCGTALARIGVPANIAPIAGQVLAGLLFCIVSTLLVQLLGWVLKKLAEAVDSVAFFRTLDGCVSCLLYMVIGVAICVALWAVLYALDYYGILLSVSDLFTEESALSNGLYALCETYVKPVLDGLKIGG